MVIPISFYTKPSRLRERMHDFKGHTDPVVRASEARAVAAIAARYILEHGNALVEIFGDWDATVAVPSTNHDDPAALQTAVEDNFPGVLAPFTRPLIRGPGDMGFNQASETGFSVADIAGNGFLLIDDTFTTGAHLQSAHHALVAAGATVPAAVIVTRKINPNAIYGSLEMWNRQTHIEFRFDSRPWWCA